MALGEQKQQTDFNVFVAAFDGLREKGFEILGQLRKAGISADMDYCDKSFKAQLRLAQRKNSRFVAVVGEDEMKDNCVMLKDMQKQEQTKVSLDNLIEAIKGQI